MVTNGKMKNVVLGVSLTAIVLAGGCTILGTNDAPRTRVAVYLDRGARNCGAFCHLRIATFAENVEGFPVDAEMIRAGALDGADVLVMPGGSSTEEGMTLGTEGQRKVSEFIRNGGGYIGTCAGCFLVSEKATKFFAKRLAHDRRFDTKIKAWMEDPNLVLHLDAVLLAKPSKEPLESEIVAFIKAGRPVFVVASNAKQRELAAKMPGVTALNSYDEVIPALEKLLK